MGLSHSRSAQRKYHSHRSEHKHSEEPPPPYSDDRPIEDRHAASNGQRSSTTSGSRFNIYIGMPMRLRAFLRPASRSPAAPTPPEQNPQVDQKPASPTTTPAAPRASTNPWQPGAPLELPPILNIITTYTSTDPKEVNSPPPPAVFPLIVPPLKPTRNVAKNPPHPLTRASSTHQPRPRAPPTQPICEKLPPLDESALLALPNGIYTTPHGATVIKYASGCRITGGRHLNWQPRDHAHSFSLCAASEHGMVVKDSEPATLPEWRQWDTINGIAVNIDRWTPLTAQCTASTRKTPHAQFDASDSRYDPYPQVVMHSSPYGSSITTTYSDSYYTSDESYPQATMHSRNPFHSHCTPEESYPQATMHSRNPYHSTNASTTTYTNSHPSHSQSRQFGNFFNGASNITLIGGTFTDREGNVTHYGGGSNSTVIADDSDTYYPDLSYLDELPGMLSGIHGIVGAVTSAARRGGAAITVDRNVDISRRVQTTHNYYGRY